MAGKSGKLQPAVALQNLAARRLEFGAGAAEEKQGLLQTLKSAQLTTADQVLQLHEILCFMQAWPDNPTVLRRVDELLAGFQTRRDLRRHRQQLADTGIAGTPINFSFYAANACWLAARCPGQLTIDWSEYENSSKLEDYLSLLASYSETPGLDSIAMDLQEWISRLKGPDETDAFFVIRRVAALTANRLLGDQFYEELDIPLVLAPGTHTPSRTRAKSDRSPVAFQTVPFERGRPSIDEEIRRPPQPPRLVSRREGEHFVDLARGAMVTRHRDLDAFAYADSEDVSLIDDDDLQFVLYGVLPARRFLLESLYGYLVLRSGVPVGYGAVTALCNSAEVAYTVFDTFRGGQSAHIYVRALVMVHHVFACDTFMVDPYQLGMDNEDALKSGAWWFYQKLGFAPRDKRLRQLMQQELSKMKRRPQHRSSITVLSRLASENTYLELDKQRDDVMGELDIANVGLKITDLFASRYGADRERGERELATEAARRLDVAGFRGWSSGEKLAWRRWSPLVALVGNIDKWPAEDKLALVQLIRAKGGRQELDYLRQFDEHARMRRAVIRLAQ